LVESDRHEHAYLTKLTLKLYIPGIPNNFAPDSIKRK